MYPRLASLHTVDPDCHRYADYLWNRGVDDSNGLPRLHAYKDHSIRVPKIVHGYLFVSSTLGLYSSHDLRILGYPGMKVSEGDVSPCPYFPGIAAT